MNIRIGNLTIVSAREHLELVTQSVADMLLSLRGVDEIGVAEIDPALSDTAAFCERYQISIDLAANCVVLEAKRAEQKSFAACVIPGNTRADVNGLARRILGARKISFAPLDQAVAETGMEHGAITPVGLPNEWPILVDNTVADANFVIIGSGIRKSKLIIPGKLFTQVPNVQILEGLGRLAETK